MVDLRNSRRIYPYRCVYWKRDDDNGNLDELTYETDYLGVFYAREVSSHATNNNEIMNVVLYNNHNITIETPDNPNIEMNDLVKFSDVVWRVDDLQKQEVHKTSYVSRRPAYHTIIRLVR